MPVSNLLLQPVLKHKAGFLLTSSITGWISDSSSGGNTAYRVERTDADCVSGLDRGLQKIVSIEAVLGEIVLCLVYLHVVSSDHQGVLPVWL